MVSLKDENKTDASAEKLVASLTGSTVPSKDIPALKYGREMESTAKAAYLKQLQTNSQRCTSSRMWTFH